MNQTITSAPVAVTDETFDDIVGGADTPVVVDFWADWCGPCHAIAPVLEELAHDYKGRVTIAKINVDENTATAARFHVRALPTLVLFKNGKPLQSLLGVQPRTALKGLIEAQLD